LAATEDDKYEIHPERLLRVIFHQRKDGKVGCNKWTNDSASPTATSSLVTKTPVPDATPQFRIELDRLYQDSLAPRARLGSATV
jgi:hypothetical protein